MPIEIEVYEDDQGAKPFDRWFDRLPVAHAAKVTLAIGRMRAGHTSGLKSVGAGVSEWRIDWGPGLRIYLGFDGERLILLLGGGIKAKQQADIVQAIERWRDYRLRKRTGES